MIANRYIDVDRLCKWLKNLKSGFTKDELVFRDELIEHLKGNNGIANVLPQVDVLPVVRCKDCKHWHEETGWCTKHSHFIGSDGMACHPSQSSEWKMFEADYFCKDGERRAGE